MEDLLLGGAWASACQVQACSWVLVGLTRDLLSLGEAWLFDVCV